MSEIGKFLRIFEIEDDSVAVLPLHEDEVDAAFVQWVERGIDKVLRLTLTTGDEYVTAASRIERFAISTPDGRAKAIALEAAADAEEIAHRKAVGLPVESDGEEWRK